MYPSPAQWFYEEDKKRKERRKANDIHLLNQNLQNLLQKVVFRVEKQVDVKNLEFLLMHDFGVVQSNLRHLRYVNNYESISVATAQCIFLYLLIDELKMNKNYSKNELERLAHQLRFIDMNEYQRYVHGRETYKL